VHVKRGQHAIDYPSRFTLVGTMNPEEGELRPQITDRIGLRVFIAAENDRTQRLEIYRRNARFARDPHAFAAHYSKATTNYRARLARAIKLLPEVGVSEAAERVAIEGVTRLGIDSHRTEIVTLEAAAALAAWEGRREAMEQDVARVFPLAARLRRSRLKVEALSEHLAEDAAIQNALDLNAVVGKRGCARRRRSADRLGNDRLAGTYAAAGAQETAADGGRRTADRYAPVTKRTPRRWCDDPRSHGRDQSRPGARTARARRSRHAAATEHSRGRRLAVDQRFRRIRPRGIA
jgi:magnesium chelatase subunit I